MPIPTRIHISKPDAEQAIEFWLSERVFRSNVHIAEVSWNSQSNAFIITFHEESNNAPNN